MRLEDDSQWGAPDVVSEFSTDGFSDAGEAAALASVAAQSRGRVLDLGVGGGRTTGLLAAGASAYVGLDIAPEMIELARERFPGVDLRVGDAGDLGDRANRGDLGDPDAGAGSPDPVFDLVMWSFNGIDVLDHAARLAALAGMAAITGATGRVLFSSLNQDGISFDERPWWLPRPTERRARLLLAVVVRHPPLLARSVRNFRRTRRQAVDGQGWATRPMRAHEFRFVVHFATLGEMVAEARAAGLVTEGVWADTGEVIDPAAAHTEADYVHLVCRRAQPDDR